MPNKDSDTTKLVPKVDVLGVPISAVTWNRVFDAIDNWITSRDPHFVCVRDVHGIVLCQKDEQLARIHQQAGMVTPDGMPLVWIGRVKGANIERICGPDLMPKLCALSVEKGYRHLLYGGRPGVATALKETLETAHPGLQIVGALTPPFGPLSMKDETELEDFIRQTKPDVMWVGLSTPKQEIFMAKYVERLGVPVMLGVGAAFDIHAGLKARAPKWLRKTGFEWTWRLMHEPHRLGPRYIRTIPGFCWLMLKRAFRSRVLGHPA